MPPPTVCVAGEDTTPREPHYGASMDDKNLLASLSLFSLVIVSLGLDFGFGKEEYLLTKEPLFGLPCGQFCFLPTMWWSADSLLSMLSVSFCLLGRGPMDNAMVSTPFVALPVVVFAIGAPIGSNPNLFGLIWINLV